VGHGNFSARTGIDHSEGELGQLAHSFDEMAEALEAEELDRKQAQEALNESEIKFKSYAEQAIVGAYLVQDGVFKYVNPKFAQMFGYTVEECLKDMPFKNLVHAEDLANVKEQIRRRTAGETEFIHYTFRGVKKNGQIFHVEIYGSSSVHKGRNAAAGTILDITERKDMEDALRESKERFRQLAEVFPDTIFEADAEGNVTYANKHGLEQFGYTEDDLTNGLNIFDLVTPDDRNKLLMRIKEKLHGIDRGYLDYQALRKDGSTFYAMGFTMPMTVNGASVGVRGFILDITERKEAEEKIAHLANHDMLTDLPSLRLAKDRLGMAISLARRNKTAAAVMFIDLDEFKSVNDNLGHEAGDYILKQVSQRMLSCIRETDTVGRVGGDEFLLIATGIHTPENASQIAEKVIHLVSQPIIFNGQQAVVGASIGIALYPDDGEGMDLLIKKADEAMYRIKKASKNGFCFANTEIK
jgi:diguanylate cyclase (GGDEF)-like protein/PAS domain S-box-containing protein